MEILNNGTKDAVQTGMKNHNTEGCIFSFFPCLQSITCREFMRKGHNLLAHRQVL